MAFGRALLITAFSMLTGAASAGQAPGNAAAADTPISHHDRVYTADQFSNTVSVSDPVDNKLLGVIRLGDTQPRNFSPLYKGQVLVHGMGFSPDHKTLAIVAIGSNSVTFIDTETATVKHTTYVGRAPHEAFYTADGKEVWVTIRGEDYISVLSASTFNEIARIRVPAGPGMQIFSPDGRYGYICSSFNPETVVVSVADHKIIGSVKQESPFCPNIAATPDGKQVWMTLKDTGRIMVFDALPPFNIIKSLEGGPITNHVNFAKTAAGTFAYVTVGGLNEVKVFRTDDYSLVAEIPVGAMPHGLWPSGDGSRIYVGLENDDRLVAIDTHSNRAIALIPVGQAPQAIAYVPNAVSNSNSEHGLVPLERAASATHLALHDVGKDSSNARLPTTTVALYDQGLVQVLQAAVTGLKPKQDYVMGLVSRPDGAGRLERLAEFSTNAAGAAIVNTIGQIRQLGLDDNASRRRYLVIATRKADAVGDVVQIQSEPSSRAVR